MANKIQHKKSSVADRIPLTSDLDSGEFAINYNDAVIFGKRITGGVETIVQYHGSETAHLFKQLADTANPAAGYAKLLSKTDGFYQKFGAISKRLLTSTDIAPSTENNQGIVEIATLTESILGMDDSKVLTPLKMYGVLLGSYIPYYGAVDDVYLGIYSISANNITATGVLTAFGGDSTKWNTAYTYSQVKHLPLSGGTMDNETVVTNLNADLLDGKHGTDYQLKLTNPVIGTGTVEKIAKFTAAGIIGNSKITETITGIIVDGEIVVVSAKFTSGAIVGYYWKCTQEDGSGGWFPISAANITKGTWDASTNTPTLVDGIGTAGWIYRVVVAGTWNSIVFNIGDDIMYNGTIWQRIPGQGFQLQTASDNVLGGIKIGAGLAINAYGVVKVTGYRHIQGTPAIVWNVTHNLEKYPSCTIVDSAGNEYEAEVKHIDANNLTITLSEAFSGYADIN